MDEDNIFDDDEALDYILYEECTGETDKEQKGGGCLGMIALLLLPVCGILIWRGVV